MAKSRWRAFKFWVFEHIGVPILWRLMQIHARTLRVRIEGQEHLDALLDEPFVICCGHGDMIGFAVSLMRLKWPHRRRTTMLTSPSRDGRLNAWVIKRFGGEVVWGSSSKRAREGLLGMHRALEHGRVVALAVDGPRGPAWQAKEGSAHLAMQAKVPLLAMTFSPGRAWTLGDWASTTVPWPFTSVMARISPPHEVTDVAEGTAWLTETLREMRGLTPAK